MLHYRPTILTKITLLHKTMLQSILYSMLVICKDSTSRERPVKVIFHDSSRSFHEHLTHLP